MRFRALVILRWLLGLTSAAALILAIVVAVRYLRDPWAPVTQGSSETAIVATCWGLVALLNLTYIVFSAPAGRPGRIASLVRLSFDAREAELKARIRRAGGSDGEI